MEYYVDTEFSCHMQFGDPSHLPEMDVVVDIRRGDVAMHYFDTDEYGAVTGVEKLDINELGKISGDLGGSGMSR